MNEIDNSSCVSPFQESIAIATVSVNSVQEKSFSFDKKISEMHRENVDWRDKASLGFQETISALRADVNSESQSSHTRLVLLERMTQSMVEKVSISKDMIQGQFI